MAATNFTPISLYFSSTASAVPLAANLVAGELALNTSDGKLYYKNASNVVTLLASTSGASGDVVGPASATDNALARFDLTTGKLIQNSVGILSDAGVLTGLTGLTSSGSITLSSLTSGRVPFATTAGLLTDSANLLYAGTDLTVYGLTVGRGAGAQGTNTAVGASALAANSTGGNNTAIGYQSGQANNGDNNTFIGRQAGTANTSGSANTALGSIPLFSNTTGSNNTAIGQEALRLNTTASNNTAVGYQAAYSNTTGTGVVAVGYNTLRSATTGSNNTAMGWQAGYAVTTGANNVAVGYEAFRINTTGGNNTVLGYEALYNNTTASNNTAVGYQAGLSNTTGDVTAFGNEAGRANTTGAQTTAIGRGALNRNTTADNNTALGYAALYFNTTGASNVAAGWQAIYNNTTGASNTAMGTQALNANTTASNNTAVGYQAAYANTTGTSLVAVGYQALDSNTTGNNNVAMGQAALGNNTTASNNTAVGHSAASANTTGGGVTAIGYQALATNSTGDNNTAMGYQALLVNSTGGNNVALGLQALQANTTASNNTAVGYQALYSTVIGASNVAVGYTAGYSSTGIGSGGDNVFVGTRAGYATTTGIKNTFVGNSVNGSNGAGSAVTTGNNNVIIGGYTGSAAPISATGSNFIVLSDGDGNVRQTIDSSGNVGIGTSAPGYRLDVGTSSVAGNIHTFGSITSGTLAGYSIRSIPRLTNDTGTFENTYIGCGASAGNIIFQQGNSFTAASNTERMRIDSSGNVLVGTTSSTIGGDSGKFLVDAGGGLAMLANRTGDGNLFRFYRSSSQVGSINVTSGATAYNTSSDYRLKNSISPMTGALAKVALLKPCTYKWNADGSDGQGFIAHELDEIVPGCVTGEKDAVETYTDEDGNEATRPAYQGIDTSFLVATLTAAIQEQQALITSLTARITALEST